MEGVNYSLFQTEKPYYDETSPIGERLVQKCFELIETYHSLHIAQDQQQIYEEKFKLNTIIIPTY